jgi:response regulator NasT
MPEPVGGVARVLVADGDLAARRSHSKALRRLGYTVAVAGTAAEVFALCQAEPPDLLLADAGLLDADGLQQLEVLGVERLFSVVLVLPGAVVPTEAALESPLVMACLARPVAEATLRAVVPMALAAGRRLRAARLEVIELSRALDERKLVERAKGVVMRRLAAGEEDAYTRMRNLASSRNLKLLDVAWAVLASEEVFRDLEGMA